MSSFNIELKKFLMGIEATSNKFNIQTAYRTIVWIYACAYRVAESISGVPYNLTEFKNGQWSPITNEKHPAIMLLGGADKFLSFRMLIKALYVQAGIFGRVGLGIESLNRGTPKSLTFCEGFKLFPVVEGDLFAGWEYNKYSRSPSYYAPDQMILFTYYDPSNHLAGLAPYVVTGLTLEQEFYIARWNINFFKRGTRPPIVLSTEQIFTPETRKVVKSNIMKEFSGVERGQDVFLAEGGYKPIPVNNNKKESDFTEGRELNREEICAAYGVPPALVGIYRYANYANSEQQTKTFWYSTLFPKMEDFRDIINSILFDRFFPGTRFEWNFQSIRELSADGTKQADAAKTYFDMGYSKKRISMILDNPLLDDSEDEEEKPPEEPTDDQPDGAAFIGAKMSFPSDGVINIEYSKSFERDYVNAYRDNVVIPMEVRWRRFLSSYVKTIWETVVSIYRRTGSVPQVDSLYWQEQWNTLAHGMVEWSVRLGINNAEYELQTPGKYFPTTGHKDIIRGFEDIMEAAVSAMMERFKQSPATIVNDINNLLLRNSNNLGSVRALQELIKKSYPDYSNGHIHMLSRSLSGAAYSAGRYATFEDRGVQRHKWVTAGDSEVRDTHKMEAGNIVDLGQRFPVTNLLYPHDSTGKLKEILNCRCTTVAVSIKKRDRVSPAPLRTPEPPAAPNGFKSLLPESFPDLNAYGDFVKMFRDQVMRALNAKVTPGNFRLYNLARDYLREKGAVETLSAFEQRKALDLAHVRMTRLAEAIDSLDEGTMRILSGHGVSEFGVFELEDYMRYQSNVHPKSGRTMVSGSYNFATRRLVLNPEWLNQTGTCRFGKYAEETLVHELGHAANNLLLRGAPKTVKMAWYNDVWNVDPNNVFKTQVSSAPYTAPSAYASTNHLEDFAEHYTFYRMNPSAAYNYMSQRASRLDNWELLMKTLFPDMEVW